MSKWAESKNIANPTGAKMDGKLRNNFDILLPYPSIDILGDSDNLRELTGIYEE